VPLSEGRNAIAAQFDAGDRRTWVAMEIDNDVARQPIPAIPGTREMR
jgi:hypothetical protein